MGRGPRAHDILRHLRQDSRKTLAAIGREEGLATSTVFEHVHKLDKDLVERYTSLLDHAKLGYPFRSYIHCTHQDPESLATFLKGHGNANNVFLLEGGAVGADMVFRSLREEEECKEALHKEGCEEVNVHRVLEPVLQEGWLPKQEDRMVSDDETNDSENSP
ncbi:MAG: Lrp/AsnC family transcriptional regulator [Candidatus Woesearchaeota archaeon]